MRLVVVLFISALAAGCVSSGKYDTLQQQLDRTKATLAGQIAERDARIQDLERQIKAKDVEIAAAEARADRNQAEIARLEGQRSKLETTLTATVRDRLALKASAEELRLALAASDRRKAEAERRVTELRSLLGQLQAMIDAGRLKVKIVDGRMVLELGTDVLFPTGSAELSENGLSAINEITGVLLTMGDRRIQIEGHTDNVPIHNARFRSNWELGAGRAITIVNTMIAAGMKPTRVSGASFGEFRPVGVNDTDPGRAANRRIEIVVVPDLSMLPGYDELQRAIASP
jgi:chemotaxis protein MotB